MSVTSSHSACKCPHSNNRRWAFPWPAGLSAPTCPLRSSSHSRTHCPPQELSQHCAGLTALLLFHLRDVLLFRFLKNKFKKFKTVLQKNCADAQRVPINPSLPPSVMPVNLLRRGPYLSQTSLQGSLLLPPQWNWETFPPPPTFLSHYSVISFHSIYFY